jgi:hypothetical protein
MRIKRGTDSVINIRLLTPGDSQVSRYPDGKAPFCWPYVPPPTNSQKTKLRSELHAKEY